MTLSFSCPTLCNPMDCSRQVPLCMEFSRQLLWSGLLCPSPGDLPDPGIEPESPTLQANSLLSELPGKAMAFLTQWDFSPIYCCSPVLGWLLLLILLTQCLTLVFLTHPPLWNFNNTDILYLKPCSICRSALYMLKRGRYLAPIPWTIFALLGVLLLWFRRCDHSMYSLGLGAEKRLPIGSSISDLSCWLLMGKEFTAE